MTARFSQWVKNIGCIPHIRSVMESNGYSDFEGDVEFWLVSDPARNRRMSNPIVR